MGPHSRPRDPRVRGSIGDVRRYEWVSLAGVSARPTWNIRSRRALNALGDVTGPLQAKNGDLWLSASIGAVHIVLAEVRRLTADTTKTAAYETFDFLDGMPGVAQGSRPLPTVLESDDGRIWFDVNDHYASIDPSEHTTNTAPPTVIIRSITDDGRRGQLDVWSEKNAGTEIELRIPARSAYAQSPVSLARRIRRFLSPITAK